MKGTITLPENLNEISIKQYQHFLKVSKDIEGDFLDERTVESFCSVELALVKGIKRKDVKDICKHINNLFSAKPDISVTFKIKNLEFGMIPSLEDISMGEYTDLTKYLGNRETMHKAMAVLYRPITVKTNGKYLIEDYKGSDAHSDLMKFAPVGVAMGAMLFFYRLTNDLLNATQQSLVEEMVEETLQSLEILPANGDGINPSMHLLKETLGDLMKYPTQGLIPASLI
jgi:hypothetical protein